jgi:voltage-gated potassium channel
MEPLVEPGSSKSLSRAERYDRWLSPLMFWLGLAFLALAAGVLHRFEEESTASALEYEVVFWGMLLIWPFFIAEGLLRLFFCVRPDRIARRLLLLALLVLAPPLRMGCRSYADVTRTWLPILGWCSADRHLRRRLEHFFSVPMMIIAFLVLPVLAMEYFWKEWVLAHFGAKLFLDVASSVIWMAFASEFILMVAVAPKKLRYVLQNWMDLAIVILPVLDFMPLLRLFRLTRVLELKQLTRLSRLYRMRGLMLKMWRAILLLDIMYRLLGNQKQKRLLRLKELLIAKEEELLDLKKEIAELERELATPKPVDALAVDTGNAASRPISRSVAAEGIVAGLALEEASPNCPRSSADAASQDEQTIGPRLSS